MKNQTISKRMRQNIICLLSSKLTSYQLADKINVNHSTIIRLRHNVNNMKYIRFKTACKLSDVYERMNRE